MKHKVVYYKPRSISNYETWIIGKTLLLSTWPGHHHLQKGGPASPNVSPLRYNYTIATEREIHKLIKVILTTERSK